MRVHDRLFLKRRANIDLRTTYVSYLPELKEDFCYRCGYCSKQEKYTSKGFEIDHFIPLRIAPEKKVDYTNLVYSCYTCNRKKSRKWPTEDKKIHFRNTIGLLDPTCDEFDHHLMRDESGQIVGKSELGNYICKKIFKFHLRPISELWKLSQLDKKIEELRSKHKKGIEFSSDENKLCSEIFMVYLDLRDSLFNKE